MEFAASSVVGNGIWPHSHGCLSVSTHAVVCPKYQRLSVYGPIGFSKPHLFERIYPIQRSSPHFALARHGHVFRELPFLAPSHHGNVDFVNEDCVGIQHRVL